MRIISWNTNGLRATVKQGNFIPLFSFNNPDVVCLQETKCEPDQLDESTRNLKGYNSYFSYSKIKKGYSGVAIYSKIKPERIEYGLGIQKFDDEGRTIIAYYNDFVLINCYFPNGGGGEERLNYKLEFYDAFLSFINNLKKEGCNVIFCGDVNTAHKEIDLARPKANEQTSGFLPMERDWISKFLSHGYIDTLRHVVGDKTELYSWWSYRANARENNVGWRIDYFYVSEDLKDFVKNAYIMSDIYGSDHCPIALEMEF